MNDRKSTPPSCLDDSYSLLNVSNKCITATETEPDFFPITTYSAQDALKLIKEGFGLAKVIESKVEDNNLHWIFLLEQLKFPQIYRPVADLKKEATRTTVYDTIANKWVERAVEGERGRFKRTAFTKKTATTWVPANMRIILFNPKGCNVGILMDIRRCQLPLHATGVPKYVFYSNAFTNNRWWIKNQSDTAPITSHKLDEVSDHFKKLHEGKDVPPHNEILAKLHRQALRAIILPKALLTDRLNALDKKFLIRHWLDVDLPILVLTGQKDAYEYKQSRWAQDIIEGLKRATNTAAYQLAVSIMQSMSRYYPEVCNEIYVKAFLFSNETTARMIFLFEFLNNPDLIVEIKQSLVANTLNLNTLSFLNQMTYNKPLAAWYADQLLNRECNRAVEEWKKEKKENEIKENEIASQRQEAAAKLILNAVKNQYFYAAQCLFETKNHKFNDLIISRACILLVLYDRPKLLKVFLNDSRIIIKLNAFIADTTYKDKFLYSLLPIETLRKCSVAELDCALLHFSFVDIDHFEKTLALREDLPKTIWIFTTDSHVLHNLISEMHKKTLQLSKEDKENTTPKNQKIMEEVSKISILVCRFAERACQKENTKTVFSQENKEGESALSLAAKFNFIESIFVPLLQMVITHDLFKSFSEKNKVRIIHYLAKHKKYDLLIEFLKNSFDFNTPLHTDVETGNNTMHCLLNEEKPHFESIKRLAQFKQHITENDAGESPLFLSIEKCNLEIFTLFVSEPEIIKLYSIEELQETLLYFLMNLSKYDAYLFTFLRQKVLTQGALAVDEESGNTALHFAVLNKLKYAVIMELLLQHDNAAHVNKEGFTPLRLAANKDEFLFSIMIEQKSFMKQYNDIEKERVFYDLIKSKQYLLGERFLQKLDAIPASVYQDENKNTSLHLLVLEEKISLNLIKLAARNHRSLMVGDKDDDTLLSLAARFKKLDVLEYLIGEKLFLQYSDLHLARVLLPLITNELYSFAISILSAKPQVGVKSCLIFWNEGGSILHFMVRNKKIPFKDIQPLLLPSTIMRENVKGESPITLAAELHRMDILLYCHEQHLLERCTASQLSAICLHLFKHHEFTFIKKIFKLNNFDINVIPADKLFDVLVTCARSALLLTESEPETLPRSVSNLFDAKPLAESKSCFFDNVPSSSVKSDLNVAIVSDSNLGAEDFSQLFKDNSFDLNIFKRLCSHKQIVLNKELEGGDNLICVLLRRQAFDMGQYVIENYANQFTPEQFLKVLGVLLGQNQKIEFSYFFKVVEKCLPIIDISTINNIMQKLTDCNLILKLIDLLTRSKSLLPFCKQKSTFFNADPMIDLINAAKERMLKIMESDRTAIENKFAVKFISEPVKNHEHYIQRLKRLLASGQNVVAKNQQTLTRSNTVI